MAFNKQSMPETQVNAPKKADVILRTNMDISSKQDEIINQTKLTNSRIDAALELFSRNVQDSNYIAKQNGDIFAQIQQENASLRQELLYLAKQNENIYSRLSDQMEKLVAEVNKVKEEAQAIDYDLLASKVAALIQVSVFDKNELNYDELADRLAVRTPAQVVTETGVVIDYDVLAQKIAEVVASKDEISPDYIASKVAEQIIIPDPVEAAVDTEALANKIAELIPAAQVQIDSEELAQAIDEEVLARRLAEHMPAMDASFDEEALAKRISEYMPQTIIDEEKLASLIAEHMPAMDAAIDETALANRVAELLPAIEAGIDEEALANRITELMPAMETEIDCEAIATRVAELLPANEAKPYDEQMLARRIASYITVGAAGAASASDNNVDYDVLAERVAEIVAAKETVSPDYIASKVVEQLVVPQPEPVNVEIDEEKIAELVAEKVAIPQYDIPVPAIDEEAIAELVAQKIDLSGIKEAIALAGAETAVSSTSGIDEEELADAIALKVGAIRPDDYEIIVDDAGCNTLSKEIAEGLDYGMICDTVSERLKEALDLANAEEPDYEEMAQRISEKITVAGVNEDVIADKAAAVLSNYLPDFDEIVDKVTDNVLDALATQQPAIDSEAIINTINEKLTSSAEDRDYDIVIDEDGITKITEIIADGISKDTEKYFERADERLLKLEESISSIPAPAETAVAENGTASCRAEELISRYDEQNGKLFELLTKSGEHYEKVEEQFAKSYERFDRTDDKLIRSEERIEKIEGDLAEIKAMLAAGAVMVGASEISTGYNDYEESLPLVKVSDIVETKPEEEPVEQVEQVEKDFDDDDSDEDFNESEETEGVDFENMMRYNRSFIARIIQGSDEQKKYYGEVKHALLSYRKVNSNVAWGAERFNKGRETIARFKMRGKTLCVYLALDPADYKTSVYHHVDVSDNKSMHGTPMMVKIKSPLGVKKVIRLIDEMLEVRGGEKRKLAERDYAAMYPYETIEQLIEDGLVKDVAKGK